MPSIPNDRNSFIGSRDTVNSKRRLRAIGRIGGSNAGSDSGKCIWGPWPLTTSVAIARGSSSGGWSCSPLATWASEPAAPGRQKNSARDCDSGIEAGIPGMFGFWLEPGVSISL